jgi:hypothetical protein
MKISFQNDEIIDLGNGITDNYSDNDKLVQRKYKIRHDEEGIIRHYINFEITRACKFGISANIFWFPLEQDTLDLVLTLNNFSFKFNLTGVKKNIKEFKVRFNCMNIEIWKLKEVF